jgi:aquaporin Z
MSAFRAAGHSTAQPERMVGRQLSPDFLDPAHEWHRLFAEAWGTFLLVVVAAGGGVIAARSGGAVTLGMIVAAPGLMVMAIIYFMGRVSGLHRATRNRAARRGEYSAAMESA